MHDEHGGKQVEVYMRLAKGHKYPVDVLIIRVYLDCCLDEARALYMAFQPHYMSIAHNYTDARWSLTSHR